MKQQTKLFFILAAAFALVLVTQPAARAQGPNADPASATFIDGQAHSIPANTAQWYKFDYRGDKSLITLLMPNGTDSLVEFNVLTPEQARSWWDPKTKPIGRGTPYSIDCTTGEEVFWGECRSNDLKWKGEFNFPGTFFVQVVNYNTGPANFTLTLEGSGVSVPPPQVITPAPPPLLPVTGGIWKNAPTIFPIRFAREIEW